MSPKNTCPLGSLVGGAMDTIGCLVGLFVVLCIVVIFYTAIKNMFSESPLEKYKSSQHDDNIAELDEEDSEIMLNGKRKLFNEIIPISELNSTIPKDILTSGTIVKVEGKRDLEYITWLAVSYYKDDNEMWGFIIKGDRDDEYFSVYEGEIKRGIEANLIHMWLTTGRAKISQDKMEKQMIVESQIYKTIFKDSDLVVYCAAEDYPEYINELKDKQKQVPYILFQNGNYTLWNKPVRGYDFRYSRNPLMPEKAEEKTPQKQKQAETLQ